MKLMFPSPRTSSNPAVQSQIENGYIFQNPPCGDPGQIPIGAPSARFLADTDTVIAVDIQQQHGGQAIQLFISYDDDTFTELAAPSAPVPGATSYETGGVTAPPLGTSTIAVALPAQTASRATLRAWDNYAFFSCADVELVPALVFDDGFEDGSLDGWLQ
jgi:hypothetical protein